MDATDTPVQFEELHRTLQAQRAAFRAEPYPSLATRLDRLDRMMALTERYESAFIEAASADFGHRSPHVTRLADIMMVQVAIRHTRRHLARWMRPRRVPTGLAFMPARSRLVPQPLGVAGVIAPWNYPIQLALVPAMIALAAGNRVMIKPSELVPRCSEVMKQAVAEFFAPEEVAVITGDAALGKAFSGLPFDHLLFTGSTAVGRHVAMAAAANLTPVTLELGGKSPAIVGNGCDLGQTAKSLVLGKMFNAGQTCIAPDYALVPRGQVDALVDAMKQAASRMYPQAAASPDATTIVSDRHHARLVGLLDDARARGARLVPLGDESGATGPRALTATIVLDARDDMAIMREEIFGPLLPIVAYDDFSQAIEHINRGERPLALYYYGEDVAQRERVLRETHAGGVTVNDCMWHFAQEELPFGGVGASGIGAYHGEAGFRTFSHMKPVFIQSRLAGTPLLNPPYGSTFEFMAKLLRRIT